MLATQVFANFTKTYEMDLCPCKQNEQEFIWEEEEDFPFDELIVSWNGNRPDVGAWILFISLLQDGEWSPWLKYAEWTPTTQKTFQCNPADSFASTYQDVATPKSGLCNRFRVKVEAKEGANFRTLHSLYACASNLTLFAQAPPPPLMPIFLSNMPFQSQIALDHPRRTDLCSPTSTVVTINYLLGRRGVDPIQFAGRSHDDEFDIYGNWILNTAQAYVELGELYRVYVQRLPDFKALHEKLQQGTPVVVSVKGTLPGAPRPYLPGHLICVIGYDPKENRVICVDPCFPSDETALATYDLNDFLAAWGTRRHLAYVFTRK